MTVGCDKPFQILSRLDSAKIEEVFALYFKGLLHLGDTLGLSAWMKSLRIHTAGHDTYLFLMLRKVFHYLRL